MRVKVILIPIFKTVGLMVWSKKWNEQPTKHPNNQTDTEKYENHPSSIYYSWAYYRWIGDSIFLSMAFKLPKLN